MVKVHQQASDIATRISLVIIRAYQCTISPMLGPRCRFYPSCSQYAATALSTHGFLMGCKLIFQRIIKCHPGHPGGIDEVPCSQHSTPDE